MVFSLQTKTTHGEDMAIIKDLDELARRRALRGARWLDKHAPHDWVRRLIMVYPGGHAALRWAAIYDTEGPLQFAFEPRGDLARDLDGRISLASVEKGLGLSRHFLFNHGFEDTALPRVPEGYAEALNRAWFWIITEVYVMSHAPLRHYTLTLPEKLIAEPALQSGFWRKFFNRMFLWLKPVNP